MKTLQKFTEEFNQIQLIKVFEFKVINRKTNQEDWIVFDIEIDDDRLQGWRVGLTEEEENSNKIAVTEIEIDTDFSIDQNLSELYCACLMDVIDSTLYEYVEE